MTTAVQSQTSKNLQISLPLAAPLAALCTMLVLVAGTGVAMMMG
jgi:hypothetical protein